MTRVEQLSLVIRYVKELEGAGGGYSIQERFIAFSPLHGLTGEDIFRKVDSLIPLSPSFKPFKSYR